MGKEIVSTHPLKFRCKTCGLPYNPSQSPFMGECSSCGYGNSEYSACKEYCAYCKEEIKPFEGRIIVDNKYKLHQQCFTPFGLLKAGIGHVEKQETIINTRVSKDNYYLDIAETVAKRGTCLRRNYGAIIVKNDETVSTGYTGAPRGRKNCIDKGTCKRQELNVPPGERYELCCSVHAEQNAIISASRKEMMGAALYLVGKNFETGEYVKNAEPCDLCKRFIINAGIEKVIIRDDKESYRIESVEEY